MRISFGNFRGKWFFSQISSISDAFHFSVHGMQDRIEAINLDYEKTKAAVNAGEQRWVVEDEPEYQYHYGEHLGEHIEDMQESMMHVRKAFVITLYHRWERSAVRWANPKKQHIKFDALIKELEALNIPVDPNLRTLNRLVNVLKHESETSGPQLFAARPDLFSSSFDPTAVNPTTGEKIKWQEWEENIDLTDEDVEAFFEVVINSSPGKDIF